MASVATRHECPLRNGVGLSHHHTSGAGKPKRKACEFCGATLVTLLGYWGVFLHSSLSGSARYTADEAESLHASEARAETARGALGDDYVTRWVDR